MFIHFIIMDNYDQLLTKNRKLRLGKEKDLDDVINHPWFNELNPKDLLDKKYAAPYIPDITN